MRRRIPRPEPDAKVWLPLLAAVVTVVTGVAKGFASIGLDRAGDILLLAALAVLAGLGVWTLLELVSHLRRHPKHAVGVVLGLSALTVVAFLGPKRLDRWGATVPVLDSAVGAKVLSPTAITTPSPGPSVATPRPLNPVAELCLDRTKVMTCWTVVSGDNLLDIVTQYADAPGLSAAVRSCIRRNIFEVVDDLAYRNGLPVNESINAGDVIVTGKLLCESDGIGGPETAPANSLFESFAVAVETFALRRSVPEFRTAIQALSTTSDSAVGLRQVGDAVLAHMPGNSGDMVAHGVRTVPVGANEFLTVTWWERSAGGRCTTVSAVMRARIGIDGVFSDMQHQMNRPKEGGRSFCRQTTLTPR